eukprot:11217051-Lingulodinium_polyedra.AAC.1
MACVVFARVGRGDSLVSRLMHVSVTVRPSPHRVEAWVSSIVVLALEASRPGAARVQVALGVVVRELSRSAAASLL